MSWSRLSLCVPHLEGTGEASAQWDRFRAWPQLGLLRSAMLVIHKRGSVAYYQCTDTNWTMAFVRGQAHGIRIQFAKTDRQFAHHLGSIGVQEYVFLPANSSYFGDNWRNSLRAR